MGKSPSPVVRQTGRVALGCGILTLVMLGVCAILNHRSGLVFLGAGIGYALSIANFFLMAWQVQRLVDKADPADPNAAQQVKARTRMSYNYRLLMIIAVEAVAIGILKADWITALMPLRFPQIVVRVLQAVDARKQKPLGAPLCPTPGNETEKDPASGSQGGEHSHG